MSGVFGGSDLQFQAFSSHVQSLNEERSLDSPPGAVTQEQLTELAQQFEKILLGMMVEEMRGTLPDSGLVPELPGHDLYEQMLYQEYAHSPQMSELSLGFAAAFERQFAHLIVDAAAAPEAADEAGAAPEATSEERRDAGIDTVRD